MTLRVEAGADDQAAFQWLLNGQPVPAGTNADLQLVAASPGNAGVYTCEIRDRFGVTRSARAALHFVDGDTPAPFGMQPDGRFRLLIVGVPGERVVVETSPDLRAWLPVFTSTPENGLVEYLDPDTPTHPWRFYRTGR